MISRVEFSKRLCWRKVSAVIAMLCLLSLTAAYAQDDKPEPEDTATYFWKRHAGSEKQYRARYQFRFIRQLPNGISLEIKLIFVQRATLVNMSSSGDATIRYDLEFIKRTTNGQSDPVEDVDSSRTVVKSKEGKIIKTTEKGSGQGVIQRYGLVLSGASGPPHPVKIGEDWTVERDNPFVEDQKVKIVSTLLGKDKINGAEVFAVQIKASVPLKPEASEQDITRIEGSYYLDPKQNHILHEMYVMQNTVFTRGEETFRGDMDVEITDLPIAPKKPVKRGKPAKSSKPRAQLPLRVVQG